MVGKADTPKAESGEEEFWRLFFEQHPHLNSPAGRSAADRVLQNHLARIKTFPLSLAMDEIARRTQRLVIESLPPATLGRTILQRAEYRLNHR